MICFNNFTLYTVSFLVLSLIAVILLFSTRELETCKRELYKKQYRNEIPIEIKPQEVYPERKYKGPVNVGQSASNIGYIFSSSLVFPLYVYRLDRNFYYYVIDSSRNNVKIPINNPKKLELYDGDTVSVPELGGTFTIKMYEYSGNIYNPFAF